MTSNPMASIRAVSLVALASALGLTGCPQNVEPCVEGDEESCDGGSLAVDGCNSPDEARATASCQLPLCQDVEGYVSTMADGGADVDFYVATLPGDLNDRSLLRVRGGYGGEAQTAVNFSINVLQAQADGGLGAILAGADRRMGTAAPKNVEIIQPFSQSNAELIVRVSDIGGVSVPRVDNGRPYKLFVCTQANPDTNEPNDTTATPVALTANGGVQQGTGFGYLATNDDKDLFSFPVATARHIIYLRITSMMNNLMPPVAYRLAYVLKNPAGMAISEGQMDNEFLQIDLSTARVAPTAGTYTLEVYGYKPPQQLTPALGDLRVRYDVEVRVMPDLDTNEGAMGNDDATTATPVNLALGTSTELTGRIATVPDAEWFRLNLPARANPAVLRFELLPLGSGGRYPPLSLIPTRQIRVVQEITTGAAIQDRQNNCARNAAICPRSFTDPTSGPGQIVTALCTGQLDPPQCLLAERNEEFQIPALQMRKNFVGAVPVPANVSALLFSFSDTGRGRTKYADDLPWRIRVVLEDDPEEASAPPLTALDGTTREVRGVLSHGHGALVDFDEEALNEGRGIRGPNDYDATETDRDRFRFSMSGAMTQSWQLEWTVGHVDGGSGGAGTVGFEISFCENGPSPDGGRCLGGSRLLVPQFQSFAPWYLPAVQANRRVQFTSMQVGNATVIRVEPVACACLTAERAMRGQMEITAVAVDRTSNDPIPYALRQSLGTYPSPFTERDGGAATCPAGRVQADGGVMASGCLYAP